MGSDDNDLFIRLTSPGRLPNASSVTGYYEEFRRATRAIAQRPFLVPRAFKALLEAATDFALSDVQVVHRNGRPARRLCSAWTELREQLELEHDERVTFALSNVSALAAWAHSLECGREAVLMLMAQQRIGRGLRCNACARAACGH